MTSIKRSVYRFAAGIGVAAPILLIAMSGLSRVGAQPPQPAKSELAGKVYKNITVLNNLPANKLIPTMHDWSAALGVKCDFCHVAGPDHTGFERDDKPTKRWRGRW